MFTLLQKTIVQSLQSIVQRSPIHCGATSCIRIDVVGEGDGAAEKVDVIERPDVADWEAIGGVESPAD